MHSGSEHTIDGKRFDLEIHVVHTPKHEERNHFKNAVLAIMFSASDYNVHLTPDQKKVVDEFFDSLHLDD